ncbi:GGDEF domain-containing protein [Dyella sp. KRB-257]|uniref:GGDEF domain-containing protein n=1 Tax=Dyella sp. KRB-257 TaxID=3400915 RepID=UPI003BFBD06B
MTDLDGLLERHKQALCWSLSLLVGVIALLEPLTAHAGHNASWMLPSLLLTLACFLNAALARSRHAKAAAHSLVVLLAAFVALQIGHHTGISWAFVLPPLVLFLHPPMRGLIYISLAVLIVTVGFSFGHAAGDSVLKAVAGLLTRELRGADIGARFGGDEFVVLLPGVSVAGAEEVARRLLKKGIASMDPRPREAFAEVTLSIGLAAYPAHGRHLNELLEAADAALLQAKAHGKNCLMKAEAPASSETPMDAPSVRESA